jgi:hypothetical protein
MCTEVCSVSVPLIELIEHDPRVPERPERRKLARTLNELIDYLDSNRHLVPDYGAAATAKRYPAGDISTLVAGNVTGLSPRFVVVSNECALPGAQNRKRAEARSL